jgi:hypothetical protein
LIGGPSSLTHPVVLRAAVAARWRALVQVRPITEKCQVSVSVNNNMRLSWSRQWWLLVLTAVVGKSQGCGTPGTTPCGHTRGAAACPLNVWPCPSEASTAHPNSHVQSRMRDDGGDNTVGRGTTGTAPATTGPVPFTPPSLGFKFIQANSSAPSHPDVAAAFVRYIDMMFPHTTTHAVAAGAIDTCTISVNTATRDLQLDTDESYKLTVLPGNCSITAVTYVGALRALETLSQLVQFDFDTASYAVVSPVEITDVPRFPHRQM